MSDPTPTPEPPAPESEAASETSPQSMDILVLLVEYGFITKEQLGYALRVRSKISSDRSMLDVLKELGFIGDEQIRTIIRENLRSVRIGSLLVELGLIGKADLDVGLALQAKENPRRKLGEVLVSQHLIDEKQFIEVLSLQLGYPMVDPEFAAIDRSLFSRASAAVYLRHNFVPIRRNDEHKVIVAFSDPLDLRDIDEAKRFFGRDIEAAIATKQSVHRAIVKYRPDVAGTAIDAPVVDSPSEIVDEIILAAIHSADVSDIHIEPLQDRLRVRFRRDGVLMHHRDFPFSAIPQITSRIKILCEADITERRRHQGGRILFQSGEFQADLRASFYITIHGEKIVLRLLNRKSQLLTIEDVGMAARMLDRFRNDALDCPSGVIIITGPTGSGKTTTLYSCINYLNDPHTSIITAEEPVEYVIDGIAQCSINPRINLTFEETLRHIVRQDPDVIVIGEIRDTYSAEVAVQAALTGHKVLTTFHTEDSIGGLIRLLNMDIDAFLISSTVVCIMAQRLLRRVCPHCRVSRPPTPRELLRAGYALKDLGDREFFQGRGCPECQHTGYKGRVAVFEMLVLNESVRDSLIQRATSHQIRQVSIESTGLVTLFEDGIAKAAAGHTSLEEVLRVLPRLQKPRPIPEIQHLIGIGT